MASVRTPDPNPGWLSDIALDETRSRVPILYVEGIRDALMEAGLLGSKASRDAA